MPKLRYLAAAFVALPLAAHAHITRIEITRTESPTFDGTAFGTAGAYEKLVGRADGEVDPSAPGNRSIVDIALAPRNARGMVEYSTDVFILRPIDAAKGNRRVFFEINNRGLNLSFRVMNEGGGNNNPTSAADAGIGYLMRQGYTTVWSGWDVSVRRGFAMNVPVAKNPDGSSITGPSLEELVIDTPNSTSEELSYPAASLDPHQAQLTVRTRYQDSPTVVPPEHWEFIDERHVRLRPAGTAFKQGSLYELAYQAKDPTVAGLAFAGVRDLSTYLHRSTDTANPLAGRIDEVYAFGISQPARFLHDFVYLGFNEDENGAMAFDGILNWIAGASGGFFNYRFAQPGRTQRQHIGRWYPERLFPFANQTLLDPYTEKADGRLARCTKTKTCPKIFEVNSANEYWVKVGALLHTDLRGHDLEDPPNVRYYHFASFAHSPASGAGMCQQERNPLTAGAGLRALLVALDDWVSNREPPPKSELPTFHDGTLVKTLPRKRAGFPAIPGVKYTGLTSTGDLFDFGPRADVGMLSILPPKLKGSPYPVLVSKTDADGNELGGIRFPDVSVPVATYTGWALRNAATGGDDLCDAFGQRIPFVPTKAEREKSRDPRLSIEERYPTHERYVSLVTTAARELQQKRFLLEEDATRFIQAAEANKVP